MTSRIFASFILLTIIWGASFFWIKIAVADIGPYALVAFRLLFGLLGLAGFLIVKRPKLPNDWVSWRDLVILGLINTALPWFLISWAEQSIDSAMATVLNSTVPLFTIILAHLFLADDRMTPRRLAGLLVGFSGVVLLAQRGGPVDENSVGVQSVWPGQIAMLSATLLYAGSAVFSRRRLKHVSPLVQAFYSMLVAAILAWCFYLLSGRPVVMPSERNTWVAIVWLGVLGAGVASYIFYFLLHVIGPTRTSLVTYTIPIVGVTLGVLVLKERLDLFLILGTVLIVSGVWVVNRRRKITSTNKFRNAV